MAHPKQFEHLKLQLEAIKSATNNFADCIGRGGFGKVYKGKIVSFYGQSTVALKRLDRRFRQGDPEFWKEIMMLSIYKHENIVSLLGFCDDHGEKILVYEYVPNKSLDYYLNSNDLRWVRRLKICIGAARGLAYLHGASETQQRVFHRDIKSSNILLDENWNAKISDFGLSKFGPTNQEYTFLFSNPVGTPGYCDPLYAETGYLTKESDVYSFGVVLFEVLCGRLSFQNKNGSLVALARQSYEQKTINEIVYGNIKDEINPDSLQAFAKLAYQCLNREREDRPLMSDIVRELETALEYQEPIAKSCLSPEPSETEVLELDHGGLLVVTIHEGSDIKVKAKHPYIDLHIGLDFRKTETMNNHQHHVWEETFKFTVENPAKATLHLELCCSSFRESLRLEYQGSSSVDISVADVVKQKHIDNVYDIAKGRIRVELRWEPSTMAMKKTPKFIQLMTSLYNISAN
ncbi:putative protein kinase RLK-Pelle-CrRLK1L-1 family [Helianthus annuus]|uniref:non-specific serine/threonine protein kinase n=1 Tax=Helianthus annuus TaxID=4232 RepID=A0A251VA44_HELAN|nr:probable receptor-like protein kinase At5g38990 [Helianthus annuus]KAF5762211.1 putative protein kinase RLK-Pelle-CrRLK1L-1 family [Helianthus annuus]KAJ0439953.1 putative protein kinase RLK-Pelle-CrRLK1L-1 family [Helianthus annuus]KAJ0642741.1 putative protein kinase RLK-Pelle-CrRLK1L-1 family [Helianthus annuus]